MDKQISITLPMSVWNVILEGLHAMPYARVSEIIPEIRKQAEKQIIEKPFSVTEENN